MNKLLTITLLAGAFFCVQAPVAEAHEQVRNRYDSPSQHRDDFGRSERYRGGANHNDYYATHFKRSNKMPYWLKRNRSFRAWYRHSPLRRYKRISWPRLLHIYRWEHRYNRRYSNRFDPRFELRSDGRRGHNHRH